MPVDNHDHPAEPASDRQTTTPGPSSPRRGLRRFTRRHAVISGIVIAAGVIALVLIGLLAYRLGFVVRYDAGQIKENLGQIGIRADIKTFRNLLSSQTVGMPGVKTVLAGKGRRA